MRVSRTALEVVREYAAERGCTDLNVGRETFYSPDRRRSVRYMDANRERILVWDSGVPLGRVSIPRERRPLKDKSLIQSKVTEAGGGQVVRPRDKGLPDCDGERERKTEAPMGQMSLVL